MEKTIKSRQIKTGKKPFTGKGKTRAALAGNIKRLRIKKKITQSNLAKMVGVSVQMIKMVEWKKMWMSERTLEATASALGTKVYLLLKH